MPTIAIIDNFPILRTGLMILLRNHIKRAYFLETGEVNELLLARKAGSADLLILGLNENCRLDFNVVLDQIRKNLPNTPVIIYSENLRSEIIISYVQSEINGYVVKSTDSAEIIRCVQDVLAGRRYLCQAFTENILRSIYCDLNVDCFTGLSRLTYREFKVACQLAKGKSVEAIAFSLGEKHSVIERLVRRVSSKLNGRNYDELFSQVRQRNSRLANYN